jgi:hypothetical protein
VDRRHFVKVLLSAPAVVMAGKALAFGDALFVPRDESGAWMRAINGRGVEIGRARVERVGGALRAFFGLAEANGEIHEFQVWRDGIHMLTYSEGVYIKTGDSVWQVTVDPFGPAPGARMTKAGMTELLSYIGP